MCYVYALLVVELSVRKLRKYRYCLQFSSCAQTKTTTLHQYKKNRIEIENRNSRIKI